MCLTMPYWEEHNTALLLLRLSAKKLKALLLSILPFATPEAIDNMDDWLDEDAEENLMIPDDVKEGQFAVIAAKGGKPERFVVELSYLSNPEFLRLLEEAKEEYGYEQKGPLALPCLPEELSKILEETKKKEY